MVLHSGLKTLLDLAFRLRGFQTVGLENIQGTLPRFLGDERASEVGQSAGLELPWRLELVPVKLGSLDMDCSQRPVAPCRANVTAAITFFHRFSSLPSSNSSNSGGGAPILGSKNRGPWLANLRIPYFSSAASRVEFYSHSG